jgi:hypothetical protein
MPDVRRRELIALLGGAAASWPIAARAQQGEGVRRIGVLMAYPQSDQEGQTFVAAFREGLQKLGWTESRNLRIDYRWTTPGDAQSLQREGDRRRAWYERWGDDRRDRWRSQTRQPIVSHSTFCAWLLSQSARQLGPPLSAEMSKISDPQYWRHRAEEARTLANALTDPDAKCKMLKVAEDYEKLAVQRLRHHSSATIRNWRR